MADITERIAKLLAQAEGTDNEHEADAFMAAAQRLATENSVDLAVARNLTISKQRTVPVMLHVPLGKRGQKGLNTMVALIGGIADANNLKYNVSRRSTYVNLFGFQEDIDVTLALFASLSVQMVQASQAFKKTGQWQADERRVAVWEYEEDYYGRRTRYFAGYEWKPVSWLSARLDFQQAFAERVGLRLWFAAADAKRDVLATASTGTDLVLANKALEVKDFYAQKSNARGSYRGARKDTVSYTSQAAGDRAGSNARLTGTAAIANKVAVNA